MRSIHQRSAELIDLIERTGMREELEARVEAGNVEKRKQLIAERTRMVKERDAAAAPLEAAAAEADQRVAQLEQELATARQAASYARQRAYGTRCHGTAQIDSEIERSAPRFMQDAFDALQEPIDFLMGTVRFWQERKRIGWNFQTIDMSDVAEVVALRRKCEDGQAEIKAMMYDAHTELDKQRARCEAIVEECVALTHPHLKDDKLRLRHEERKERAATHAA
ncbi:conserved hypothetical protein [Paraburkholderia sacchari]|uniref:hypothetical protein n=1 Tax=Paraburkholderia sacchari TaxID=159450 RepID=UPI0039A4C093